jgi:hypothetical protein
MSQLSLFDLPGSTESTSSAQDTLVSLLVLPGSEEARKTTVTSGLRCLELYKKQSPVGSLARMLLGTSQWDSTLCFLTWQVKGTKQFHLYFQLQVSVPRINDTESSLWPTPIASSGGPGKNTENKRGLQQGNPLATAVAMQENPARMWPTPQSRDYRSADNPESPRIARKPAQGWSPNLNDAVKFWPTPRAGDGHHGGPNSRDSSGRYALSGAVHHADMKMWPTPRANDAEKRGNIADDPRNGLPAAVIHEPKMWPTPQAGDEKDRGNLSNPCIQRRMEIGKQVNLSMCASDQSGQLNPEWVETLMGFPPGWTEM